MRDRASVSSVLKTSMYAVAVAVKVDIAGAPLDSLVEDIATKRWSPERENKSTGGAENV
jgi:hypothetical protein